MLLLQECLITTAVLHEATQFFLGVRHAPWILIRSHLSKCRVQLNLANFRLHDARSKDNL